MIKVVATLAAYVAIIAGSVYVTHIVSTTPEAIRILERAIDSVDYTKTYYADLTNYVCSRINRRDMIELGDSQWGLYYKYWGADSIDIHKGDMEWVLLRDAGLLSHARYLYVVFNGDTCRSWLNIVPRVM